jgi:hypothetical protein
MKMSNQLPITACILLDKKNVEIFPRCLKSLNDIFSEILVLDNNSGFIWDNIDQSNIKVYTYPEKIQDFSQTRQELMRLAIHEWVLFIDSDEVLLDFSVSKLNELISNPQISGFYLSRSDVFYGKKLNYGEAGNQQIIRLMRKDLSSWQGAVHEVAVINGQVADSGLKIEHFSHPTVQAFLESVNEYSQFRALDMSGLSFSKLLWQLMIYPPAKLFQNLILKAGILDGWHGAVYAYCMSLHSILVRIYNYEYEHHK